MINKLISLSILLTILILPSTSFAQGKWRTLFDGKTLTGWKANYAPDSYTIVDGILRVHATKPMSHLFFVGNKGEEFERFKNFELEATVKGEPDSNSGIFIHTDYSVIPGSDRLAKGYEVQLNSTPKEKRKTGSLYLIVDLDKSPVDETQWFKIRIKVQGNQITVSINDAVVVDYTEPEKVERPPTREGRRLNPEGGAIALQAHDLNSTFYFKDIRIRSLP